MKRTFTYFTILVLSVMLGATVVAAKAPPASLCYHWDGSQPVAMMAIKNQGTIKTSGGPVVNYSINGSHLFQGWPATPITGTATFANGILRFNHTCIVRASGTPGSDPAGIYMQLLTEGTFDTATGTGAMTGTYVNLPAGGGNVTIASRFSLTITGVVCKDYSVGPLSASEEAQSTTESTENGLINGLIIK